MRWSLWKRYSYEKLKGVQRIKTVQKSLIEMFLCVSVQSKLPGYRLFTQDRESWILPRMNHIIIMVKFMRWSFNSMKQVFILNFIWIITFPTKVIIIIIWSNAFLRYILREQKNFMKEGMGREDKSKFIRNLNMLLRLE